MSTELDVVIPVYNAAGHIASTMEAICQIEHPIGKIICVDDGSTDATMDVLNSIKGLYVIQNQNNQGQHAATRIGLKESSAEWVLTIDDDLPIAKEQIDLFIESALDKKASLCYATYKKHTSKIRNAGSKITNELLLSRFGLKGTGSSTRMIHRSLLDRIYTTSKPAQFLDVDLLECAEEVAFVEVHSRNHTIKSRYSNRELVKKFTQMLFRK